MATAGLFMILASGCGSAGKVADASALPDGADGAPPAPDTLADEERQGPQCLLTVTLVGNGRVDVSGPSGMTCQSVLDPFDSWGIACKFNACGEWKLENSPLPGWVLSGWSGDCQGDSNGLGKATTRETPPVFNYVNCKITFVEVDGGLGDADVETDARSDLSSN
jgi:hypothetical protein